MNRKIHACGQSKSSVHIKKAGAYPIACHLSHRRNSLQILKNIFLRMWFHVLSLPVKCICSIISQDSPLRKKDGLSPNIKRRMAFVTFCYQGRPPSSIYVNGLIYRFCQPSMAIYFFSGTAFFASFFGKVSFSVPFSNFALISSSVISSPT